jgi:hypothetical protein
MIKESIYFNYEKFDIPYLHITGNQPEMYVVERSTEFYDSIASGVKRSMLIEEFAHHHFPSQIGLIPALVSDKDGPGVIDAYFEMCQLARSFADAFLKGDEEEIEAWQ